jgi:multiple sugar transport system permease protein
MTTRPSIAGRRILRGLALYVAVAAYVLFALFPIYWTLKISVTPTALLYTQGVTAWPSRATLHNYMAVLETTAFPRYFSTAYSCQGRPR